MIGMAVVGMVDGAAAAAAPAFELGRGAIAGAFIVATAFLAGYAAIRRSGLAVCALLTVLAAAALELSWLGFFPALPGNMTIMILGLFAAAAIIFLSASIGAAKYNALLGGVMFTAALVIAGMGLINFIDRINVAPLMRWSVIGVGAFGVLLALTQALRGDVGARLILPGVALAIIAPLVGPLGAVNAEGASLLPHGLFTLGVLAASIVSLTESAAPQLAGASPQFQPAQTFAADESAASFAASSARTKERAEIVLDSQLARVLDYSGVAVWDWSLETIDQTESLPGLLGADSTAPFTPDALRNFIHKEDIARFEKEVLAPIDGPFDVALKLFDGRKVRLRGARAANEENGELERLVAFIETASPIFKPSGVGVDGARVQKATTAAIVPAATSPLVRKMADALAKGDIVAAFQPIISLKDDKVAGYEALARWRDQEPGAAEGPETFVKAADIAGKGGVLARAMLEHAAAFLSDKIKNERRGDLFVAMNVTWGQMREPSFADAVRETIAKYDLPKNTLVLELTEGDAVTDHHEAGKVFSALKRAGAALAFDDFGAGFSCLSNLRKYDFDYLKIDKSFTADLDSKGDGAKIVGSLASLGKDLGLKVIVEGVESKSAAKAAAQLGCAYAQGFALGEPAEFKAAGVGATAKFLAGKAGNTEAADAETPALELATADEQTELKTDFLDAAAVIEEEKKSSPSGRWMFRRRSLR